MNFCDLKNCDIHVFKRFREWCAEVGLTENVNDSVKLYAVSEGEAHFDSFSSKGKMIYYDATLCNKYALSEKECFACIAHELGHIDDKHLLSCCPNESNEEISVRRYYREFNADVKVSEFGLETELIDALHKMCSPDDYLTTLRCKRLEELKAKRTSGKNSKITSILVMILALLLNDNQYGKWDGKNHPEADIIVASPENPSRKLYFEIKETKSSSKVFGAATLTEWKAASENKGRYFFVVIYETDNGFPKYVFYTPKDFVKYSTVPPFKINFNIKQLPPAEERVSVIKRLAQLKQSRVVDAEKWNNTKNAKSKSVKFDGKILNELKKVYYGKLKSNS